MMKKMIVLMAVLLALLLSACKQPQQAVTAPGNSTSPTTQIPQSTEPTAPADGNPNDVTCKGSYSATDSEAESSADTVVATLGAAKLTNGQLQVYYRMAVAAYAQENGPDMTKPLDVQLCDADDTAVTWQQYFLAQALDAWQRRQTFALQLEGDALSQEQKAFLDGLSELTGGDTALTEYAKVLNHSYLFMLNTSEELRPTEEEMEQLLAEKTGDETLCVDIRYILLPAGSEDVQVILDAFLAAYGQEDDFAMLARQYSMDEGTRKNGGLYTHLEQGDLIPELDSWCFDPERKTGDYVVVETELGIHILYFRGINGDAAADTMAAVIRQRTAQSMDEIAGQYTADVDYSKIQLAPLSVYDVTDAQLLFDQTAGEKIPEMPLMIQQNYPYSYYGPGRTVSSHGCGLTCFAMVATYLLDEEQSPADLGPRFASYSAPEGTARSLFNEGPATMGFGLVSQTMDDEEALTALKDGHVVVSLQQRGLFTEGGHYIVLVEYQEDGKIKVLDPNKYNYVKNSIREDGFANGFEEKYITAGARLYWIYEKKTLVDPACTYCGSEDTEIFTREYYCDDCRELLAFRELFEQYCG